MLAVECYKASRNIGPSLLNDIFQNTNYAGPTLRNKGEFVKPSINSVHFGENSLKYLGSKIWDLIPKTYRDIDKLDRFKQVIKTWKPKQCPCRLCKTHICGVGFVNII